MIKDVPAVTSSRVPGTRPACGWSANICTASHKILGKEYNWANNYNRQGARKALSLHGACHGSTRQSEDWAVANSPGGLSRKPTTQGPRATLRAGKRQVVFWRQASGKSIAELKKKQKLKGSFLFSTGII
jgi:hypothetical protein